MKIFSGSTNLELTEKISNILQLTISQREIFVFPDGERRIQLQENVVDENVVIVQSTNPPVDSNYIELFFLSDAAKRSGAKNVIAVIPYIGYQRQDHIFREGEAVSLEVMVKTMEAVGIEKIITFDLHSIKIPEFFKIPLVHLSALKLFSEKIKQNGWIDENTNLVTPDMGGVRRIKYISELLNGMKYTSIVKDRDVNTGKISSSGLFGDIKKRMIIIDDMISSGGTIIQASDLLNKNGAEEIYAFVSHAIFSQTAPEDLQNSKIDKIYITDSVYVPNNFRFEKLEIISIADMIATSLKEI